MNKPNINKWIFGIRKMMVENGVDDSALSDSDVLKIQMGFMLPLLEEGIRETVKDFETNPVSFTYFKSLLSVCKPQGEMFEGIDIELLRAKLNNN